MKRLLHLLTVTCVAAVGFFCALNSAGASDEQTPDPAQSNEAKSSNAAAVNVDAKGVFLKGYDVVAYFKQGKPLKGNPAIESTYQGVTYLFASEANKADFEKDPAKYVPQYGGFCAYGVANGVISGLDAADAFTIYKGKLYLGGNQDALKSFKTHIDDNIRNADAYWRELTGS